MFKKLLTTMLVMAIIVTAGTAFAGDMSFKFYGKVHNSINMLSNGDESEMTMTSNNSRFGVKGGYELNEDYTAIWQFENKLNTAQGGGSLAMRNSFVGVKANWGTLIGGIHDTPLKTVGQKATFFKDQIGDHRALTMGMDRRAHNILIYSLPSMDNDQLYADDESATTFGGALFYTPENLYFGFAYETMSAGNFSRVADGAESESVMRIAARYDADQFGLVGFYQSISNGGGIDGMSATTMGFEGLYKAASSWNLKASYFMADANTDVDDSGWGQMAVGVDHAVTENFTFYVQYAATMNDDGMAAGLGGANGASNGFGGSVPSLATEDATGISIGSWVTF